MFDLGHLGPIQPRHFLSSYGMAVEVQVLDFTGPSHDLGTKVAEACSKVEPGCKDSSKSDLMVVLLRVAITVDAVDG